MSTKAFHSRRVTETLRAIGDYLDSAAKIAGGVPRPTTISLELEDVPENPTPRITEVLWENGSSVIQLPTGAQTVEATAFGDNLTDVTVFKLRGHGKAFEGTITVHDAEGESVTAAFDFADPPPGKYDAHVITTDQDEFLLLNACRIEVQDPGTPAYAAPQYKPKSKRPKPFGKRRRSSKR
jgi:hypothetical protein